MVPLFASLLGILQVISPGPSTGEVLPPGVISPDALAYGVGFGPIKRRRKRWDLVCDMRSDTCSDGRRIATTRSTPVPCEVSPGVWEMVPEDTACISVRGLESWAANTSYLSYGAELDRSPWRAVEGATISGRILSGPTGSARLLQVGLPPEAGTWTLACRMRALSGDSSRLRIFQTGGTGGSTRSVSVGADWATYSETWEIGGEPSAMSVHIYPDGSTLEIAGCWLTRSDTPGRACWGGEAPVTCAADRHTISTEGWPTEAGEVSVVFSLGQEQSASDYRYLIDGRGPGGVPNVSYVYIRNDRITVQTTEGRVPSGVLTWEVGRTQHVRVRVADGSVYLYRDGLQIGTGAGTFLPWSATALIGRGIWSVGEHINGSISSLRVRSFE